MKMWYFALILLGAQLCSCLPRQQQQQDVEVLDSVRVNCKFTATVNYPSMSGEDALPTVDCTTKCTLKTKGKDQTYFIGYVYRHFERLEKEYGLMLQIRYNKGGDKSCVLVPAAGNEEVLSPHLEGNSPCVMTTVPSTTLPTTLPSTTISTTLPYHTGPSTLPTTVPITHEFITATLGTTLPPTTVPTTKLSNPTEHTTVPTTVVICDDFITTTVPTTLPPTTIPTTVPITHNPVPTTLPTTLPPTTLLSTLPITHDVVLTTLPTTVPPTTVPTTLPITHDPIPTTLPTTLPPTTVPTTVPITHEPIPTTLPTTLPPTTVPTTVAITHDPTQTTLQTTLPPTTIPTTVPITHDAITTLPTTIPPTTVPTTTLPPTTIPTTQVTNGCTTTTSTTTLATTTSWVCGSDWFLIGTACFHISEVRGDWSEGQDYCAGLGATLASVRSQEEQDGLAGLIGDNAWIGLHDMQSEGEHRWEDQTALSYSNWEPGQPDNSGTFLWWGSGEDCVEMNLGYSLRWNDQDCDNENIYICRREAEIQG